MSSLHSRAPPATTAALPPPSSGASSTGGSAPPLLLLSAEDRAARNAAQTAIGRNGALDDLAGATVFLAAPASAYVTGQTLAVDGGFTAK